MPQHRPVLQHLKTGSYSALILGESTHNFRGEQDVAVPLKGLLEQPIPGDAKQIRLVVGEEEYLLEMGHLDPADQVTGAQARLDNLGFDVGEIDGQLGPRTADALRELQTANGLTASGQLDESTRAKLIELYGS